MFCRIGQNFTTLDLTSTHFVKKQMLAVVFCSYSDLTADISEISRFNNSIFSPGSVYGTPCWHL